MWTLNSLRFCTKEGEFRVYEEYIGLVFNSIETADLFISKMLSFWSDTLQTELTVSSDRNETIKMGQIEYVFRLVAKEFGVNGNAIFIRRQTREMVEPRQFAMNILMDRKITPTMIQNTIRDKYPKALGFDRTNIINHRKKLSDLMKTETDTREKYEMIKDKVLISLNGRFLDDGSGQKLES